MTGGKEARSVGSFSPDGKRYAAVFRRNEFKISSWSPSGSVDVEHAHVDKKEVYECLEWFSASGREILALGCRSGAVQVWDVTLHCKLLGTCDELEKLCPAQKNVSVSAIALHSIRKSLYIASSQCNYVLEIDLDTPSKVKQKFPNKTGVFRLAVSEDRLVVAGAQKIKAFSVDGQLITKYTAPVNSTTDLRIFQNYILAADSSEAVAVYNLSDKAFSASLTTGTQATVRTLVASPSRIVGLSADGRAAFSWKNVESVKTGQAKAAIASVRSEEEQIICVLPESSDDVRFAVGSAVSPRLVTKSIASGAYEISPAAKDECVPKRKQEAGEVAQPAKKLKVTVQSTKVSHPGVTQKEIRATADLEQDKVEELLKKAEHEAEARRITPFKTGGALSLAPMIKQYLKGRDETLLSSLLAQLDKRVILASAQDLASREAFDWFSECGALLFQQPKRANLICEWMRCILQTHCSYLLANPSLRQELQPLYEQLRERLQSMDSLLRIQGKLDLLIATAGDRIAANQKNCQSLQEPLKTFREGVDDQGLEDDTVEAEEGSEEGSSELDGDELAQMMEDEDFDPELLDEIMQG